MKHLLPLARANGPACERLAGKVIDGEARVSIQERLDELAERRKRVEEGLAALEQMVREIEADMIEKAVVQEALRTFASVFDDAPPYLKKQFVRGLIGQVRVSDLRIALGLDGRPGDGVKAPENGDPSEAIVSRETGSLGYQSGGDGRPEIKISKSRPMFRRPAKSNISLRFGPSSPSSWAGAPTASG